MQDISIASESIAKAELASVHEGAYVERAKIQKLETVRNTRLKTTDGTI